MEGYSYSYPSPYPPVHPEGQHMVPDHGDGLTEYYNRGTVNEAAAKRSYRAGHHYDYGWPGFYAAGDFDDYRRYYWAWGCADPSNRHYIYRPSGSQQKNRKNDRSSRSNDSGRSRSRSRSRSKSRSKSWSSSRNRTKSMSRSCSRSHSRSRSVSPHHEMTYKEPGLLDAFRVMYLTPSNHKRSTTKYLTTKKKQDKIQELLKSDGLGSKRWLFYPRNNQTQTEPNNIEVPGPRDNCDQRIKVDGVFFRKFKKSRKVDLDAPVAKLKRWELILYKKLGFIQAI